MAELKTKENEGNVAEFLAKLTDEDQKKDCWAVLKIMKEATKAQPKMWGNSIVGFGRYRYKYESGREGKWLIIGFSPRKHDLTLYIMPGFEPFSDLMARLGKYKTGKSCLYIKSLKAVDLDILKELVRRSVAKMASQRVDQRRHA